MSFDNISEVDLYSFGNTTGSYMSNNESSTLQSDISGGKEYDCKFFKFIIWGVVGSSACILGMLGNVLVFVAFHRDRRTATITLLQTLACSDFLLLASVFITDDIPTACDYLPHCENIWYIWPYIRYVWVLTPMAHMCSIWVVVLIAANRYWAVCRPHSMTPFWSLRRANIYVSVVVFLVLVFNSPRFFEYRMVETFDNSTNMTVIKERRTVLGNNFAYKTWYKKYAVNVILIMLPLLALICLTIKIFIAIHSKTSTTGHSKQISTLTKAAQEITFVLSIVLVVAIICQVPLALFHFLRNYDPCGSAIFYLDNISKLMVNLNSCFNFVVYSVFSSRFRNLLLATLSCGGKNYANNVGNYSTMRTMTTTQ